MIVIELLLQNRASGSRSSRSPQPKHLDPGGPVELRMDNVHGRFFFDNGVVTMNDVSVQFRGSLVRFANGTV